MAVQTNNKIINNEITGNNNSICTHNTIQKWGRWDFFKCPYYVILKVPNFVLFDS